MQPPKNLDNYAECVRERNGKLYVFCVECDAWRSVSVWCRSDNIVVTQDNHRYIEGKPSPVSCHCLGCGADVGYLLTAEHIQFLSKKLRIEIPVTLP